MSNTPVCINCTYNWHILLHSVVTVRYTHCMYDELSYMPYILQHSDHVTRLHVTTRPFAGMRCT